MTCSIARWLRAAFLPTWWADLPDWRCFWPPLEFTACWLIWSANDRTRSVSALPWARGGAAFWECSFARGVPLAAWGSVAGWAFFGPPRPWWGVGCVGG